MKTSSAETDSERLAREHRWRLKLEKAGFNVSEASFVIERTPDQIMVYGSGGVGKATWVPKGPA